MNVSVEDKAQHVPVPSILIRVQGEAEGPGEGRGSGQGPGQSLRAVRGRAAPLGQGGVVCRAGGEQRAHQDCASGAEQLVAPLHLP